MADTAAIRDFVHDLLRRKGEDGPCADDAALLTSGRLDSVDVLEIVNFLEQCDGLADNDLRAYFDRLVDEAKPIDLAAYFPPSEHWRYRPSPCSSQALTLSLK